MTIQEKEKKNKIAKEMKKKITYNTFPSLLNYVILCKIISIFTLLQ